MPNHFEFTDFRHLVQFGSNQMCWQQFFRLLVSSLGRRQRISGAISSFFEDQGLQQKSAVLKSIAGAHQNASSSAASRSISALEAISVVQIKREFFMFG